MAQFKCSKCGNLFMGLESSPGVVTCPHCGATIAAVPYDPYGAQPVAIMGNVIGGGGATSAGGGSSGGGAVPSGAGGVASETGGGSGRAGGWGPGPSPRTGGERLPSDWEAGWRSDFFGAFLRQIKAVILDPIHTTGLAAPTQDYFGMALFVFLATAIGFLPSLLLQLVFMAVLQPDAGEFLGQMGLQIGLTLFMPLIAVAMEFVWAGIWHLSFRYLAGSQKDYATSFTTMALGRAAAIFGIVPCIGPVATMVYAFIVGIGGMAEAHEVSGGKAALAYLAPLVICCCCIFLFYFVAIAGIGILATSQRGS